jgi:hypothetical protein
MLNNSSFGPRRNISECIRLRLSWAPIPALARLATIAPGWLQGLDMLNATRPRKPTGSSSGRGQCNPAQIKHGTRVSVTTGRRSAEAHAKLDPV